jgi:ATP-dependent DNA ligase
MVSKRSNASYVSGRTRAWLKTKCYMTSELEVAAVLQERGKPTMALMVDGANNYMGGAFITNRRIKERLLARVRSKARPAAQGHVEEAEREMAAARRNGEDQALALRGRLEACQRAGNYDRQLTLQK